jgi:hypothetical protein
MKVTGLDTIKRFQGTVKVAPSDILPLGQAEESAALGERFEKGAPTKVIPPYSSIIPGYHPGHSLDVVSGRFPRTGADYAYFLGYDEDNLWIDAHVPRLLNKGNDMQRLFATGDAIILELGLDPSADPERTESAPGDVRIVVSMLQDKPVAVLYRYRVDGAANAMKFQSPGGQVTIDKIELITAAEVKLGTYESTSGKSIAVIAKIPWKSLTDTPAKFGPQVELRGDAGFVIGNANGTAATQRINWANKATGIVGDAAAQARLMPNLWGVFNPRPKTR